MLLSKAHVEKTIERILAEYRDFVRNQALAVQSSDNWSFPKELDRESTEYYRAVNQIRGVRSLVWSLDPLLSDYIDGVTTALLAESKQNTATLLSVFRSQQAHEDEQPRFVPVGPATETVLLSEVAQMIISSKNLKDTCEFIVQNCRREVNQNPANANAICTAYRDKFVALSLLLVGYSEKRVIEAAVGSISSLQFTYTANHDAGSEHVLTAGSLQSLGCDLAGQLDPPYFS